MNTVCIYIHRGNSFYLDDIFAMTRHYNLNNRIILIGDKENCDVAKKHSFEHFLIQDYDENIPYHHVSVNTESYEKFCFQRWFILRTFVTKQGIDHFVYSDSDNTILYDFNTLPFRNAYLGHSTIVVPNLFFCETNALNLILQYYIQLYSQTYEEFYKTIATSNYLTFHENDRNRPHFSDMMFLKMAIDRQMIPFESLQETPQGEYCFNANIHSIQTKIRKKKVYVENTDTYLKNIHFAGNAKEWTQNYRPFLCDTVL